MKKQLAGFVFVVAMFFVAGSARAEAYLGVGVSNYSYDYSDLDNSTGNKIFGGYYFKNGAFAEVARVDLGDTQSDLGPVGFQASGFAAYIGYRGQANTGFAGFGKIGWYSFDTDLLSSGSTVATESGSGLSWALGFTYAFNKNFALRGELEQYVGVEDFADDESVTGGSVSLEFRF